MSAKTTEFYKDGKTRSILEYDGSLTSKALKVTYFRKDGRISMVEDFDPTTEKVIKLTRFDKDGKPKILSRKPIA